MFLLLKRLHKVANNLHLENKINYNGALINIGIYIYENAEVLDFSGPFEVYSTANRFLKNKNKVFLIGQTTELFRTRGGFNVLPHYGFDNHPPVDLLIVVGGIHDP